jgi:hemolysin activation/secretion protein
LSILLAGSLGLGLALPAFAQVQTVPTQSNPGLITPSTPEQLPGGVKKDKEKLPAPQEKMPDDTLDSQAPQTAPIVDLQNPSFVVKQIQVEGNTVVRSSEIQPLLAQYEGREVTLEELGKLVDSINKLYYEKGYYSSQAYIPPQDVDQQSVTIKVMEGRIGNISITGNRFLRAHAVLRDVDQHSGEILNVQELQDRLRRISGQPTTYKLKGVLTPSSESGKTDIELQVRERFPWQISPTFDNQGRPHIGTNRWGVELDNGNVTGMGDRFNARWIGASGTQMATASYFVPLNRYGTQVGTTFAFSEVNLDLGTANQPKIIGRAYDYAGVLVQPLDREQHFTTDMSVNFRRIFTIFAGDRDQAGQTDISALRFGLTYNNTDRFGRTYLRAQTSVAPGWLGANRKFWKNDLIATRIVTLPQRNLLILRGQAQLTPDGLPAAELMQIGGAYSVRGYTEGLLAGDRGYSFSVEHRWPIPGLRLVSPWLADRVQGASFFDFGKVRLDRSNSLFVEGQSNRSNRTLLAGAGIGVRARMNSAMQGFVDLGWGLANRGNIEPNAQPSLRVHFGLRSNLLPEDFRDWTKPKQQRNASSVKNPATQPPNQPPLMGPELPAPK